MASFCVECGSSLEQRDVSGKSRDVCTGCGRVHYDDPKVAVGVVVEKDGGIVLGKRAHDPMMGRWSFPSGFVDVGEVVETAAIREVEEETGLIVSIDRLLGVYSTTGNRVIFIAFAGHATGGTMAPGAECFDVQVFPPDALPDMAFPHDGDILAAWADRKGAPA